MARAGQVIENPVTGERVVFRKTAADTKGALLEFDLYVKPHGFVAVEHLHAGQDESFEVIAGELHYTVGRDVPKVLGQGQSMLVRAGLAHNWWNEGDEALHARVQFRPALNAETFLETVFGLARDGKTDDKGQYKFLQIMLLSREYGLFLPKPPVPMQKVLSALLAPLARLTGLRARYPQYSEAV